MQDSPGRVALPGWRCDSDQAAFLREAELLVLPAVLLAEVERLDAMVRRGEAELVLADALREDDADDSLCDDLAEPEREL